MGKDYMARKAENDNYETPYSLTKELMKLGLFDFNKSVGEVACGEGAIQHILNQYFSTVICYDIRDTFYYKKDFFEEKEKYDYIITNPVVTAYENPTKSK